MDGGAHSVGNQLQIADLYGPTMYGYSMGGRLALYIAVKHAFYLPALILESTSAGLEDGREKRVVADEAWAMRFETEPLRDVLQDWYSQPVFAPLGDGDAYVSMVESRFLNDGRALARSLRGMSTGRQEPLWDMLHTVDIPVLLLAGEHDPRYIELMQRMAGLLPRAEMHIVPRAGHNVHVDNPDGVCDVVLPFLKKIALD